jgi:hypothetical protein
LRCDVSLPIDGTNQQHHEHFVVVDSEGEPGRSLNDVVVDASVVFKWLIPDSAEEDVAAAKAVLIDRNN